MLSEWKPTRDTLHQHAKAAWPIHAKYKHWWHIALNVSARGLTTTLFPVVGQNVELILDLSAHRLVI
jgi:hypothetical protein